MFIPFDLVTAYLGLYSKKIFFHKDNARHEVVHCNMSYNVKN